VADDRLRIEIALDGQQVLSLVVTLSAADELDRALADGKDGAFAFEADDGRYTVVLNRVVYVRRFARESRVGFGATP
jgi:hypothetical protein